MTSASSRSAFRVVGLLLILPLSVHCAAGKVRRTHGIEHVDSFFVFSPDDTPDISPAGVASTIRVVEGGQDRDITGELIEVRNDGFLILSPATSRLMLVPYSQMSKIDFGDDVGANTQIDGYGGDCSPDEEKGLVSCMAPLSEDEVRQRAMALFSRYPFGLDDAMLQRLLEALGQSELEVIGS